jgi:hypothetical protein
MYENCDIHHADSSQTSNYENFFRSEIKDANFSLISVHYWKKKVTNVRCFISTGIRKRINRTVFQFAFHYTHIPTRIHIHTYTTNSPPKQKNKNQKPKHPQTAPILHILTKRIDPGRKCKMQNQMTKNC